MGWSRGGLRLCALAWLAGGVAAGAWHLHGSTPAACAARPQLLSRAAAFRAPIFFVVPSSGRVVAAAARTHPASASPPPPRSAPSRVSLRHLTERSCMLCVAFARRAAACEADEYEIIVTVETDIFYWETSWVLQHADATDSLTTVGGGEWDGRVMCWPEGSAEAARSRFILTVQDLQRDGMSGDAFYRVELLSPQQRADGDAAVEIYTGGGNFGAEQVLTFTPGCDMADPIALSISPDSNADFETTWDVVNSAGELIARGVSSGGVICAPTAPTEYTLSLRDSFGDGLGRRGSYSAAYGGRVIASGGQFGHLETTRFVKSCPRTVAVHVDAVGDSALEEQPNPTWELQDLDSGEVLLSADDAAHMALCSDAGAFALSLSVESADTEVALLFDGVEIEAALTEQREAQSAVTFEYRCWDPSWPVAMCCRLGFEPQWDSTTSAYVCAAIPPSARADGCSCSRPRASACTCTATLDIEVSGSTAGIPTRVAGVTLEAGVLASNGLGAITMSVQIDGVVAAADVLCAACDPPSASCCVQTCTAGLFVPESAYEDGEVEVEVVTEGNGPGTGWTSSSGCSSVTPYAEMTWTSQIQSFCASAPCLNGGLCVEVVGGFRCECTMAYAGYLCEWDALLLESHGNCSTAGCRASTSFSLATQLREANSPGAAIGYVLDHATLYTAAKGDFSNEVYKYVDSTLIDGEAIQVLGAACYPDCTCCARASPCMEAYDVAPLIRASPTFSFEVAMQATPRVGSGTRCPGAGNALNLEATLSASIFRTLTLPCQCQTAGCSCTASFAGMIPEGYNVSIAWVTIEAKGDLQGVDENEYISSVKADDVELLESGDCKIDCDCCAEPAMCLDRSPVTGVSYDGAVDVVITGSSAVDECGGLDATVVLGYSLVSLDMCADVPCQNGGICFNKPSISGRPFTCQCISGYAGDECTLCLDDKKVLAVSLDTYAAAMAPTVLWAVYDDLDPDPVVGGTKLGSNFFREADATTTVNHCVAEEHFKLVAQNMGTSQWGTWSVAFDGVPAASGVGDSISQFWCSEVAVGVSSVWKCCAKGYSPAVEGNTVSCACDGHELKIEIVPDTYPAEISFNIRSPAGGEVVLLGGYEGGTFCGPSESFEVRIKDNHKDGFCCEHGTGSYTIAVDGEIVIDSLGDFRDEDVHFLLPECEGLIEVGIRGPYQKTSAVRDPFNMEILGAAGDLEWKLYRPETPHTTQADREMINASSGCWENKCRTKYPPGLPGQRAAPESCDAINASNFAEVNLCQNAIANNPTTASEDACTTAGDRECSLVRYGTCWTYIDICAYTPELEQYGARSLDSLPQDQPPPPNLTFWPMVPDWQGRQIGSKPSSMLDAPGRTWYCLAEMPVDSWGVGSSYVFNVSDHSWGTFGWDVVGEYYVKLDGNVQYSGALEEPFGIEIDRDTKFPYGWEQEISCGPASPPAYNLSWCCPAGYYTPDCIDFDECAVDNGGCDEHSICTNLDGDFSCGACAWGWNGTICLNLTDGGVHKVTKAMSNASIFNVGRFDRVFAGLYHPNTFECTDSTGWFADGCINIDDCYSGPCQNGGVCIDEVDAYQCDCPVPYVGEHCELYAHKAQGEYLCQCGEDAVCQCELPSLRTVYPASTLWFEPPYDDPSGALNDVLGTPVQITDTPRVRFWNTSGMTFVKRGDYIPKILTSLNYSFDLEFDLVNISAAGIAEMPTIMERGFCDESVAATTSVDMTELMLAGGFEESFSFSIDVIAENDVSEIVCGQPADGATECPDNPRDCQFRISGVCSDSAATTEIACLALGSCQNLTSEQTTLWDGSVCDHLGSSVGCTGTATIDTCAIEPTVGPIEGAINEGPGLTDGAFNTDCAAVGMIPCMDDCVPNFSDPPDCERTFDYVATNLRSACPAGCTYDTGVSTFVECSDATGSHVCVPRGECCEDPCKDELDNCDFITTHDPAFCLANVGAEDSCAVTCGFCTPTGGYSTQGSCVLSRRSEQACVDNLGVVPFCEERYWEAECEAGDTCETDLSISVQTACPAGETWVSDGAIWTPDTQGECWLKGSFAEFPIRSVPGCTDSTATNYDFRANVDDGSCRGILEIYRASQWGILVPLSTAGKYRGLLQEAFPSTVEDCAMACEATGDMDIFGTCQSFSWTAVPGQDVVPGMCSLYPIKSLGPSTQATPGYHMPTSLKHKYYERGVLGCTDAAAVNYDIDATVTVPWDPCDFGLPEPEPSASYVPPVPEPEPAPIIPDIGDCDGATIAARVDFYVADIDDCGSTPCRNGGTCEDGIDHYYCTCAIGYNGDSCQRDDDECASNPCTYGECIDGYFSYTCVCPSCAGCIARGGECGSCGFSGGNCSTCVGHHWTVEITPDTQRTDTSWDLRDPITNRVMLRGRYEGTDFCENSTTFRFTIRDAFGDGINPPGGWAVYADGYMQAEGYSEENRFVQKCYGEASSIDEGKICDLDPATPSTTEDYPAACPIGCTQEGSRKTYEIDVNDCIPNPVSPKAGLCARPYPGGQSTCFDGVNDYECVCLPGYEHLVKPKCAAAAEEECTAAGSDKAACVTIGVPFNTTLSGSCVFDSELDKCRSRHGAACATADLRPALNKSMHDRSCSSKGGGGGACVYDQGRPYCELETDECGSIPCANGGTCADLINNYTCACIIGFTGYNCEVDIDDCAEFPCQNNGLCVDGINSFVCECRSTPSSHFEGVLCETEFLAADLLLVGFAICCVPLAICLHSCRGTWVARGSCIGGNQGGKGPGGKYAVDPVETESILHQGGADDADQEGNADLKSGHGGQLTINKMAWTEG